MWKVLGAAGAIAGSVSLAQAEDSYILNQNQTGLNLPGVSLPQGYDEVRTSDGSFCRSSVSGNGAYLDMGVIGSQNPDGSTIDSGAVYGRVVVPLGRTGSRLDCRRLYDLEIERLKMEVRLLRAGMGQMRGGQTAGGSVGGEWTNTGRQ